MGQAAAACQAGARPVAPRRATRASWAGRGNPRRAIGGLNGMNWIGKGQIAVGMINFFAFVLVAERIGGDAANGKVENGRYDLRDHGRLTEVGADLFAYSLRHAHSLWVTHPLACLGGLWLSFLHRRRNPSESATPGGPP
jgi:hypothetical protein